MDETRRRIRFWTHLKNERRKESLNQINQTQKQEREENALKPEFKVNALQPEITNQMSNAKDKSQAMKPEKAMNQAIPEKERVPSKGPKPEKEVGKPTLYMYPPKKKKPR